MTSKRIVIAGASGLIGKTLAQTLTSDGAEVVRLVRRAPSHSDELQWQPGARLDPETLRGIDAVVCLNGASIGRLPWTRRYRRTLVESRLRPTRTLANALRELGADAPHFIAASAVGYYGHRPGERLVESDSAGSTFLAKLCVAWEEAALGAGPEVRVSLLRTAPLLHPQSVLKPLMLLTRLGAGGPLGDGKQYWPWISLEDEVRAIHHVIVAGITGPVNLTGPTPATASEIGRELARQMHRPYFLPAPKVALRLALGKAAANSLLLADARVEPLTLTESGFTFEHPTVSAAIASALEQPR